MLKLKNYFNFQSIKLILNDKTINVKVEELDQIHQSWKNKIVNKIVLV